jgi:hypothetical protein
MCTGFWLEGRKERYFAKTLHVDWRIMLKTDPKEVE